MNLEFFPHFIRKNYPALANEITNEEAFEIGEMFKKYLLEKFKDKKDKLEEIWNIDAINVIMNQDHPLKTNGYHPALILHFTEFCKTTHENGV